MTQYIGNIPDSAKDKLLIVDNSYKPDDNFLNNGHGLLNQRKFSSVAYAGSYVAAQVADSWGFYSSRGGWTVERDEVDVPSIDQAGVQIPMSFHLKATTAYTTNLETGLGFGIAGKYIEPHVGDYLCISFWMKSNVSGETIGWGVNNAHQTYTNRETLTGTISNVADDTWEKKTILIPMDYTHGSDWEYGEHAGLTFILCFGTSWATQADGSWNYGTNTPYSVNSFNLQAAVNNYIKIAGMKIEGGRLATQLIVPDYERALERGLNYFEILESDRAPSYARIGSGHMRTAATGEWIIPCHRKQGAAKRVADSGYATFRIYTANASKTITSLTWPSESTPDCVVAQTGGSAAVAGQGGGLLGDVNDHWYIHIASTCGG